MPVQRKVHERERLVGDREDIEKASKSKKKKPFEKIEEGKKKKRETKCAIDLMGMGMGSICMDRPLVSGSNLLSLQEQQVLL